MDWDYANSWIEIANHKKEEDNEPKWKFDCGFKLDFDGSIISVSSRFYPPHKNSSGLWEGNMHISVFGEIILTKEFKNNDLDALKIDVEKFIKHYKSILISKLQY